jgi:acyl-CoA thioesterase-1
VANVTKPCCRLVFFGDSICNGQGVSIHRGWVTQLSAAAEALSKELGHEIIVVNASVNGRTTRQALEQMPYEIQSHGVDILLIQFGLNDCNFWTTDQGLPRVSPEGFEANLIEIIRRGLHFGARAVFLNTNHPTGKRLEPQPFWRISFEDSNKLYNKIIRKVAKHYGTQVSVNDIEKEWLKLCPKTAKDYLMSDRLHLSPKGHDFYYKVIGNPLIEAMRDVCRPQAPQTAERGRRSERRRVA